MSSGLLRNSFSNFFAGVIPAIATLITVPVVVSHLGAVQYGIFLLLTSIVGYFSVLDINASAGSMKYLAEYHAQGESTLAAQVITCGALIYLVIGIIGAVALFGGAGWVLDRFFEVPAALRATTVHALQIGAVAFIFGQMQAYLTSVPQALLRYDISARYESIFGVLVSVSTMAVVLAGGDLISIMLARLVISMANCGLLIAAIRTLVPHFEFRLQIGRAHV